MDWEFPYVVGLALKKKMKKKSFLNLVVNELSENKLSLLVPSKCICWSSRRGAVVNESD